MPTNGRAGNTLIKFATLLIFVFSFTFVVDGAGTDESTNAICLSGEGGRGGALAPGLPRLRGTFFYKMTWRMSTGGRMEGERREEGRRTGLTHGFM